jgi:N utilization substance protein A
MSPLGSSEDDIRTLYRKHVPEVAAGTIEIMSVAREPGRYAMVAARSHDLSINPVSACVGNGAAITKAISSESGVRGICVIMWSESVEELIARTMLSRSMDPSRPPKITLDEVAHQAFVQVEPATLEYMTSWDSLLLKLACRLVGWEIKLSSFDKSSSR